MHILRILRVHVAALITLTAAVPAFGLHGAPKPMPGQAKPVGSGRCPHCGGRLKATTAVASGFVCRVCHRSPEDNPRRNH